jgi:hypothetical protein
MTTPYPINELFVWVVDDPTRQHAIMGMMTPGKTPMQCVSSKRKNMERSEMQLVAAATAEQTGHPVKLQRFVLAETLVEIKG